MIFLSAQPDQYYFLWQLQLQVNNFNFHGIAAESIHILIGYDEKRGLNPIFKSWIASCTDAKIFTYPDTRLNKDYSSSIRPHILAKHFGSFTELHHQQIFYHDSDILFNRLPDFKQLAKDDIWYSSDTRSYLNSDYITSKVGEDIFEDMIEIVGLPKADVLASDENAGGAQYLLKNIPSGFWEKMETDCLRLFSFLERQNNKLGFDTDTTQNIQSWCSDMWCMWWNAILFSKGFRIAAELDFVWAFSDRTEEISKPIIHYTGNVAEHIQYLFRKNNYVNCSPFHDDFSLINENTSSFSVVEEIKRYNNTLNANKIRLQDLTFLIPIKIDSEERLENLYLTSNYLFNNFDVSIIILEADSYQKIDCSKLPRLAEYHFVEDHTEDFHRTRYNNQLIRLSSTKYIALYDVDVILPVSQIQEGYNALQQFEMVYPYDGTFLSVDILMKAMFRKMPDASLFEANINKHSAATKRSYGGCIFLERESYITAGMENEYFSTWGPEDMERWKRMKILGFRVYRVSGNLYHLPHPRLLNSGYKSMSVKISLLNKYLKIAGMDKDELKNHINTWPWLNNKQIFVL